VAGLPPPPKAPVRPEPEPLSAEPAPLPEPPPDPPPEFGLSDRGAMPGRLPPPLRPNPWASARRRIPCEPPRCAWADRVPDTLAARPGELLGAEPVCPCLLCPVSMATFPTLPVMVLDVLLP
jgi:hypothetical protein